MQKCSGIEMACTFLLLIFVSVLASPFEKKADIAAFTSAINGAGRLRYGKRSEPATVWENDNIPIEYYMYPSEGNAINTIKRAINTDSLVASLNGAERLRFGRK